MDEDRTKYTAVDGIPQLKAAIVDKFARENNITCSADMVTVGTGGKQVLYNALMATLEAMRSLSALIGSYLIWCWLKVSLCLWNARKVTGLN